MHQLHLFIGGYVHSVGFRAFVKREAEKLGLTGWVRNLTDRRVEVIAQGKKEDLEKLIEECKKGPFMAEVKGVSVTWEGTKEEYSDFKILLS
ncbi:MAG: acylphosphatase [Candidatus Levybacteria bacterium]|nr:acylphosphatase [Candidatus Levybacteria bacterium]